MTATLEYIAVGGNRHSSAADWKSGLLAFGAGHNIALWDPENEQRNGINALLSGHTDSVNAIRIHDTPSGRTIVSGSADMTIRLWKAVDNRFHETQCLTEHTKSINALAIHAASDIFVSSSADSTVKVWHIQNASAKLLQSISLKPKYLPLALALTSLSNGALVLAVAGTSNNIQLYVQHSSDRQFQLQATLTGHEGWIRSLDFTNESPAGSDILLASASQDKYVRLWRFHPGRQTKLAFTDIASAVSSADKKSLSNKAHEVGSPDLIYSVTFEALLIGHEDWIYTARWEPSASKRSPPALLSASADNSLSIWHLDEASGLWVCKTRLGEISAQKGSTTATGSAGGFWIGLWQPQCHSVVSLGRTGSWRQWSFDTASGMWLQHIGISGHVQEVQSIGWSKSGSYLLTTALDQTTRLIAQWQRDEISTWHEISRPQIHGYDLNCINTITDNQFVSGADEKLLRVFNKPKAVDLLVSKLSGLDPSGSDDLPDAANIPVLGLSNKAMTAAADDEQADGHLDDNNEGRGAIDPVSVVHKSTLDLRRPPFEDHLARHTLWPEHEKLYGHGYEISAVAATNDGTLIATACKASSLDHAVIRLYETVEWREIKPSLSAHSLTVTSLAFSPDDQFLLSVGRDRQWALFERSGKDRKMYNLYKSNPKGHSRMILDCSWAPGTVGNVFATAGRDKSFKIWKVGQGEVTCTSTVAVTTPVTAVAFSPDIRNNNVLLAQGNEDGSIVLHSIDAPTLEVRSKLEVDPKMSPSRTVNALRWRPFVQARDSRASSCLAAASDDFSVRIYSVL